MLLVGIINVVAKFKWLVIKHHPITRHVRFMSFCNLWPERDQAYFWQSSVNSSVHCRLFFSKRENLESGGYGPWSLRSVSRSSCPLVKYVTGSLSAKPYLSVSTKIKSPQDPFYDTYTYTLLVMIPASTRFCLYFYVLPNETGRTNC